MERVIEAKVYYVTTEGPDRGRPLSINLEAQDKALTQLGVESIRMLAREKATIEQIDALSAQMRELLSGIVVVQTS